jgi:hypothetical protein
LTATHFSSSTTTWKFSDFSVSSSEVTLSSVSVSMPVVVSDSEELEDDDEVTAEARGHRHRKKVYRVDFFVKAISSGLTNYIIRHNSQLKGPCFAGKYLVVSIYDISVENLLRCFKSWEDFEEQDVNFYEHAQKYFLISMNVVE